MALKIRLARGGAKKRPFYRIVVAEASAPRDGRYVERVGTYNPMVPKEHEQRMTLNSERITFWLGQGAKPTDRVHKMLAAAGLAEAPVIRDQPKKSAPGKKRAEREAEAASAAEAAAESAAAEAAAAEEAAAAAPAEEAPAEEAIAEEAPAEEAPAEEAVAEEAPAEEAPAEEALLTKLLLTKLLQRKRQTASDKRSFADWRDCWSTRDQGAVQGKTLYRDAASAVGLWAGYIG
jgi:small subunit ribosomal protein S16